MAVRRAARPPRLLHRLLQAAQLGGELLPLLHAVQAAHLQLRQLLAHVVRLVPLLRLALRLGAEGAQQRERAAVQLGTLGLRRRRPRGLEP